MHNIRRTLYTTLLCLACIPFADAASCRAGTAAQAGSQAGYNRAKEAADAWSQRQNNVSASLGDCLGNISTTITAPTFPNLADALNQIGQKICAAARDKINDYVPPTIDPWVICLQQQACRLTAHTYRPLSPVQQLSCR